MEEGNARKNYLVEYEPRRNRLTHDLIYEEFEMVLEDWVKLQQEYDASTFFFITQMVASLSNDPHTQNDLE
jgi:hypothetical protein